MERMESLKMTRGELRFRRLRGSVDSSTSTAATGSTAGGDGGDWMEGEELEGGWNAAMICGGVGDDGGGDGDMEDGTMDGGTEGSFENRVS